MTEWSQDENPLDPDERRWPMAPNDLLPRERWRWWEQLWSDVLALGERYRVRPAKDWWEDGVQAEALAALAAWVGRYDTGEWDDPPGKLSLLYDLERVRELIRGTEPFHPGRDRAAFSRFLIDAGCQPPPGTDGSPSAALINAERPGASGRCGPSGDVPPAPRVPLACVRALDRSGAAPPEGPPGHSHPTF